MKRVSSSCPKPEMPLGQQDVVDAVLQVGVFAAHVELAEGILHHARRAQHHLVEGRVGALRFVANLVIADAVLGCAETRDDLVAIVVELRTDDHAIGLGRGWPGRESDGRQWAGRSTARRSGNVTGKMERNEFTEGSGMEMFRATAGPWREQPG